MNCKLSGFQLDGIKLNTAQNVLTLHYFNIFYIYLSACLSPNFMVMSDFSFPPTHKMYVSEF